MKLKQQTNKMKYQTISESHEETKDIRNPLCFISKPRMSHFQDPTSSEGEDGSTDHYAKTPFSPQRN